MAIISQNIHKNVQRAKDAPLLQLSYVSVNWGGSIHTVKENAEALEVATEEIGLEVNAERTKYMVMSREQTAGLSHTTKFDNSSIGNGGRVQVFGNDVNKSKFYSERN